MGATIGHPGGQGAPHPESNGALWADINGSWIAQSFNAIIRNSPQIINALGPSILGGPPDGQNIGSALVPSIPGYYGVNVAGVCSSGNKINPGYPGGNYVGAALTAYGWTPQGPLLYGGIYLLTAGAGFGNWSAGNQAGYMQFTLTPQGGGSPNVAMELSPYANMLLGTTTDPITTLSNGGGIVTTGISAIKCRTAGTADFNGCIGETIVNSFAASGYPTSGGTTTLIGGFAPPPGKFQNTAQIVITAGNIGLTPGSTIQLHLTTGTPGGGVSGTTMTQITVPVGTAAPGAVYTLSITPPPNNSNVPVTFYLAVIMSFASGTAPSVDGCMITTRLA